MHATTLKASLIGLALAVLLACSPNIIGGRGGTVQHSTPTKENKGGGDVLRATATGVGKYGTMNTPTPKAATAEAEIESWQQYLPKGDDLLPETEITAGLDGWSLWLQPGGNIPGTNRVSAIKDNEYGYMVEFERQCPGNDGGAAGLYLQPNLPVGEYKHLYVWLVLKVISEEGGNIGNTDPRWFPEGAVQVRIKYLSADDNEAEWYHGFFAQRLSGFDTANFTRVSSGKWYTYISDDLMALPDAPQTIEDFRVYGFGWRFQGQVAQAVLIGSNQPVSLVK